MNPENKNSLDDFINKLFEASIAITNKSQAELYQKTSAYIKIAEAYEKLEQHNTAMFIVQNTYNLNLKNQSDDYLYYSLEDIAEYYLKQNNKPEAIELLNLAFASAKKISDYEERDHVLTRIGDKFGTAGDFNNALECAELVEDDLDRAYLYQYLAQEAIDSKQYKQVDIIISKAQETGWGNFVLEEVVKSHLEQVDFERAFKAVELMTQEQAKASALSDIALKHWQFKDTVQARANLSQAQEIVDQIKDSNTKSWSLQAISRVSQQIDSAEESNSLLSASVNEAKQIDDVFLQGFAFNNLAFQLASAGKYDEAIETIESSNPSIPKFQKVRLLIQVAKQYQKSNQPEQADRMIKTAIETVAEVKGNELAIPDEHAQSFAWNDIADYALENEQYDLAWKILEQIKPLNFKITLLIKISDNYIKNNQHQEAHKTLEQAIQVFSKIQDKKDLSVAGTIAYQYAEINDYHSALEAVKLMPADIQQAQSLIAIALKYAESPQPIDSSTFELIETLM